jgi:pimeloyl-ACP methyl ester carboxylesterase
MGYFSDTLWHGLLRRPYRLAKVVDQGSGQAVILLHGIGRNGEVWRHVTDLLTEKSCRVVAFDLLGFGASPKPKRIDYNVDDHAQAVIASIEALRLKTPVAIVGHSMGCLVAVRAARLRPDLVRHMVLYEMPLYEGLPQKRIYRARLNLYFKLYERIIAYQPSFDKNTARLGERMAAKIAGFEITRASWLPFVRSLKHTIMQQTAAEDIKKLSMPVDVIYGLYDTLVIRGKPRETFGHDNKLITAHTVRARHEISPRASQFIVERIIAIDDPERDSAKSNRKAKTRAKRFSKTTRRSS